MKEGKMIFKVVGNIIIFCALIYLILAGQKNLGIVPWIANILVTTNVRPIGVGVMIASLIGLLIQLYCYNKKYQ